MTPVILAGGSGTRLWPLSRSHYPKQFCKIFDKPLFAMTFERVEPFNKPIILASKVLRSLTEKTIKEFKIEPQFTIYEPVRRNTAPATALLCKKMIMEGRGDEVLGFFPSDQLIENLEEFYSAINLSIEAAKCGKIVVLGLKPTHPETGFGYIQTNRTPILYNEQHTSFPVVQFHEKPSLETAKMFLTEGSYYWNAGIFIFRAQLMYDLICKFQPQIENILSELNSDFSNLDSLYPHLPNISIDFAVMEKLSEQELACVPCQPEWNDIGSWDAISNIYEKRNNGWVSKSTYNSKNCFVFSHLKKDYALVGVDDLIIVDTDDAILVTHKGLSQDISHVVEKYKKKNSKIIDQHLFEERPWGRFDILKDEGHYKSKIIRVLPQAQLSYQSHKQREEHWIVTRGEGYVILNEEKISVRRGSHVHIPIGAKHRIKNTTNETLEFFEVQIGTYFGEDDIIRYEDDYNRDLVTDL